MAARRPLYLDRTSGQVQELAATDTIDPLVLPAQAAIVAAAGPVGATQAVVASLTIPAGLLVVGTVLRVRAYGTMTGTSPTLTARLRLGTAGSTADAQVCATGAATIPTGTGFVIDGLVTVRTAGAGGTVVGNCQAGGNNTAQQISAQSATAAVNTTVANILTLTLQGAGTTPAATVHNALLEIAK